MCILPAGYPLSCCFSKASKDYLRQVPFCFWNWDQKRLQSQSVTDVRSPLWWCCYDTRVSSELGDCKLFSLSYPLLLFLFCAKAWGPLLFLSLSPALNPKPILMCLRFPAWFRPALPCPALPCPALPCPALPCPALPCPALALLWFWQGVVCFISLLACYHSFLGNSLNKSPQLLTPCCASGLSTQPDVLLAYP